MTQHTNPTLDQLADLVNEAGAEGVFIIRGAKNASLIYEPEDYQWPRIPGAEASTNLSLSLDVADAGILVLIRFPVSDGGEAGIESK